MYGYSWIDSSRFSLRDRKFFRLAFLENRHRDDVCRLMGIKDVQFYKYYNKLNNELESDFRRFATRNPHAKVPDWMRGEVEEEPVKEEDIRDALSIIQLQKQYLSLYEKLPNRYKNDREWLLSKINQDV